MIPELRKPKVWICIALLIPFCKPVGIDYFTVLRVLFFIWKLAALAYLAVMAVQSILHNAKPINRAGLRRSLLGGLGLCLFWVIYFIGCVAAGADVISVGTDAAGCCLLLFFINHQIRTGRGKLLLRAMAWLFSVYIVLHVVSVFLVRLGWLRFSDSQPNTIYLFGYDNYSAFFLYPMLAVVLFYRRLRFGRIDLTGWVLTAILVLCYVATASMTAAGAGILMVGLLLTKKHWQRFYWMLDVRWMLVAIAVFLVLICVFQVQNVLAFLLNAMEKGVTLNSRTYIWDMTLDLIAEKPVFGHGSFTQEQIDGFILYGTTHAHNLLLELLLRTGLVGTAGYALFLCLSVPPRYLKKMLNTETHILLIGLATQMVLSVMDFYPNIQVFYCFMGLLYNSGLLIRKKKNKRQPLPKMEENS